VPFIAVNMATNIPEFQNRILTCLPAKDLEVLYARLEHVGLPVRMQLDRANRPITHAYFLEDGLASVVANGMHDRTIEVGMIGSEGVTGLAIALGAGQWPQETFMQTGGHGYRIAAGDLIEMMEQSSSLRRCMLSYAHIFTVQAAQTCLANGRSKLEERLARWLLMAHDRLETDELNLTHDFLADMLGVRRPGVSLALNLLEQRGVIYRQRGKIRIVDRTGLTKSSRGAYGVPEAEFQRLFD
jgi:CRP-like cAMP-binding protein